MASPFTSCVICHSSLNLTGDQDQDQNTKSESKDLSQSDLLETQLNVIFILRDIFEVKPCQLEVYLKWGDPGTWVKLCVRCEEDVSRIRKIFATLHEIKRELEKAKYVIKDRVRATQKEGKVTEERKSKSGIEEVWNECRSKFFRRSSVKSSISNRNPFPEGDQRAKELAFMIELENQYPVKEEVADVKDEDDNYSPMMTDDFDSWNLESFHDEDSDSRSESSETDERAESHSKIDSAEDESLSERIRRTPKRSRRSPTTRIRYAAISDDDADENKKAKRSRKKGKDLAYIPSKKSSNQKSFDCPVCGTRIFVASKILPISKHLSACIKIIDDTNRLKCSMCKSYRCPSSDLKGFMEHVALCRSGHHSDPIPWRHAMINCNLCQDSCYLPYPEFAHHIYNYHKHKYGCSQCGHRSQLSADITRRHWKRHESQFPNVPTSSRYEKLPDGTALPLPSIPWWCPGSGCLKQFPDESSRDGHLQNCTAFIYRAPPRSLKCSFCSQDYFFEEELLMHRVTAHGYLQARAHKCEECDIIFETPKQVLSHQRQEHGKKLFKCETCGAEFVLGDTLLNHKRLQHGMSKEDLKELTCHICQKVFGLKYILRQHIKRRHKCEECMYECKEGETLTNHRTLHHTQQESGKMYTCPKAGCNKFYPTKGTLTLHISRDHRTSNFVCSFCGKKFMSQRSLRLHTKLGKCRLPKLRCKPCKLTFATMELFTEHRRAIHKIRRRPQRPFNLSKVTKSCLERHENKHGHNSEVLGTNEFKCSWEGCGRSFKNDTGLKLHVGKMHERQVEEVCSICDAKLSNKENLRKHMIRIHGIKSCKRPNPSKNKTKTNPSKTKQRSQALPHVPCMCDHCGNSFSHPYYLRKHVMYYHENKFPARCDLCNKGFACKLYLLNHNASVHGIGDFKCDVEGCSKVFWKQELFTDHKKYQHEGMKRERPKKYACQFCGKGFSQTQHLKRHEETMHINQESKPYKCELPGCGKTFATNHYLQYHLKHTHKIKKSQNKKATD